jgi:hypothetical protein
MPKDHSLWSGVWGRYGTATPNHALKVVLYTLVWQFADMNIVTTWMYCTPRGDDVLHPQVGMRSSDQRSQNYYWRCVFLLFESSARHNIDARHVLFVNQWPPAQIDGVETRRLIDQYRIEVVELQSCTRPPPNYWEAWNTQFVVLDVLEWVSRHVARDDTVLILDSDMVFNRPISAAMSAAVTEYGALLYSIDYPVGHRINGLTLPELQQVSDELEESIPSNDYVYCGGEFVCATGENISRIHRAAIKAYAKSLSRHAAGQVKFNEEAHLLSHVYRKLAYETHTANAFVKRIWTDRAVYSNVDGSEKQLVLWHLPAEKKRGFLKMFLTYRRVGNAYALTNRDFEYSYRVTETLLQKPARWTRQILRIAYK